MHKILLIVFTFTLMIGVRLYSDLSSDFSMNFQAGRSISNASKNITRINFKQEASFDFTLIEKDFLLEMKKQLPVYVQVKNKQQVKKKTNEKITRFKKVIKKKTVKRIIKPIRKKLIVLTPRETSDSRIINNKELINHYGFKIKTNVPRLAWSNYFKSINLKTRLAQINDERENQEIDEERRIVDTPIRLAQAAPARGVQDKQSVKEFKNDEINVNNLFAEALKIKQMRERKLEMTGRNSKIKSKNSPGDGDLEFFDYSVAVEAKKKSGPIGPTIPIVTSQKKNKAQVPLTPVKIPDSIAKSLESLRSEFPEAEKLEKAVGKLGARSITRLRAEVLDFSEGRLDLDSQFRVMSSHLKGEVRESESGEVVTSQYLPSKSSVSIDAMRFMADGYLNTKYDLVIEHGESQAIVPLISIESFEEFVTKKKLSAEGANLIIELADNIKDIKLDKDFEEIFYFDENFEEVKEIIDASYMLFMGVAPGNTLLQLVDETNNTAEKIIHLSEDEFFYEESSIYPHKVKKINLWERKLMSSEPAELSLDTNMINFFNRSEGVERDGINVYNISTPILPRVMREYLELTHFEDSIFIGLGSNGDVEVPSRDFVGKVIEMYDLGSLEDQCIIQVNLDNKILSYDISGETVRGAMNTYELFLDKDGYFSEERNSKSEKIFIMGDLQGVINMKLNYTNGTSDTLQSFCSQGTYLVESL